MASLPSNGSGNGDDPPGQHQPRNTPPSNVRSSSNNSTERMSGISDAVIPITTTSGVSSSKKSSGSTTGSGRRTARKRCGECDACRRQDCGKCYECVCKKKFGGDGSSKQACIMRRCVVIQKFKKDRKRGRSTGFPIDNNSSAETGTDQYDTDNTHRDDDEQQRPTKKQRRRGSSSGFRAPRSSESNAIGGGSSSAVKEKEEEEPIVAKLKAAFPGPPSLLATTKIAKKTNHRRKNLLHDFKYGRPVPEPAIEVCAGCRRVKPPPRPTEDEEDDGDNNGDQKPKMDNSGGGGGGGEGEDEDDEPVILLCDGPNCQSEYHLECCIPPISEVPAGNYYCVDCNPTGSSAILEQYLNDHDERRSYELGRYNADDYTFLFRLWNEDLEDNQDNWNDEKPASNYMREDDEDDDMESSIRQRIPQSELASLLELQYHLMGSPSPQKPCAFDFLCGLLIGRPIRLYCPLDDNYHSGRIVDYRPIPANLHKLPRKSTDQALQKGMASTFQVMKFPDTTSDAKLYMPNDDFFTTKAEFLVRFVPGSHEYRKTLLYRWIRLEEHSMAVGTHMIWGKFQPKTLSATSAGGDPPQVSSAAVTAVSSAATTEAAVWQPAIMFLRTTRELMPVLHLLQEDEGEIHYHPRSVTNAMIASVSPGSRTKKMAVVSSPFASTMFRKEPRKVWALAKRLGAVQVQASTTTDEKSGEKEEGIDAIAAANNGEAYKLLRVVDEACDFSKLQPGPSHFEQLKHSLAYAELQEQRMAAHWKKRVNVGNKFHPKALTARDQYAIGPACFLNKTTKPLTRDEKELCPLIRPPGIDRAYLMTKLVQRGLIDEATKDTAADLECWLVP